MKSFKSIYLVFLMAFCFLFILSCKEKIKEETLSEKQSIEEISDKEFKELWEKVDALWEKKDPNLIYTVYADNFKRISPGGTSTSVEELTKELKSINNAYPDMTLDLERFNILGDMVIVHWSVDGTFTGELGGVKGNGKPFKDVIGISVFTVKNGKIIKDDSYWDTFAIFRQTGYIIQEGAKKKN